MSSDADSEIIATYRGPASLSCHGRGRRPAELDLVLVERPAPASSRREWGGYAYGPALSDIIVLDNWDIELPDGSTASAVLLPLANQNPDEPQGLRVLGRGAAPFT